MRFIEAFQMAWASLRSNKMRTALTLLGMIIGVFAIIASVTAVSVIDVFFKERLNLFGASTFQVERYGGFGPPSDERQYRPPITFEQVERLKEMVTPSIKVSLREDFDYALALKYGGRETDDVMTLFGVDQYYSSNYGFEIDEGRGLTLQDVQYGRPFGLITEKIAEELFPNESPLGKDVIVGRTRLQIVGVLKNKGQFLGYNPDYWVYAPITHLLSKYGGGQRNIGDVSIKAAGTLAVPAAMEEVIGHLRVIRKVNAGEENNFDISTNDSIQEIFEAFTGTLTIGGAFIGFIALFAAGIGIMNIMLVSVTERTREIGIRKSVGAKRRDILSQFLLEAFFLCQIGGLLGIILGALGGNMLAYFFEITPAFPWGWAIFGFFGVTFIAVVFGVYPAYKAASLDPIESLRFE